MNIDWSKAPEGTTHYAFAQYPWVASWYIVKGDDIASWLDDGEDSSWGWRKIDSQDRECILPRLIPRPVAAVWTGEGLPPVGTVCETNVDGTWEESTVLAHHREMAIVFRYSLEHEAHMYDPVGESQVRLIRTPEQIAAEEREKAIAEMVYGGCGCDQSDGTTTAFVICRLLYDAGYRKQVAP